MFEKLLHIANARFDGS
jgi:hypothetical protein